MPCAPSWTLVLLGRGVSAAAGGLPLCPSRVLGSQAARLAVGSCMCLALPPILGGDRRACTAQAQRGLCHEQVTLRGSMGRNLTRDHGGGTSGAPPHVTLRVALP